MASEYRFETANSSAKRFRKKALKTELCSITSSRRHELDLRMGKLLAHPDATKVKELVELSWLSIDHSYFGEHDEMLALVANQDQINDFEAGRLNTLHWYQPHHVAVNACCSQACPWVALSNWLAHQGLQPCLEITEELDATRIALINYGIGYEGLTIQEMQAILQEQLQELS
jgi:hypothetical protein